MFGADTKQVRQADDSAFALTRESTNHHFVLLKSTAQLYSIYIGSPKPVWSPCPHIPCPGNLGFHIGQVRTLHVQAKPGKRFKQLLFF
jgi:hypothetical protein